jgi:nicotinamide riboside kinase
MALLVSLLGAESTGKTDLAQALVRRLERSGWLAPGGAWMVPEYLREFCDRVGRTPRQDEQAHIAEEQTRRIQAALARADVVVADTTALMTAVYSDYVFDDRSLYEPAAASHRASALTLVTALDLPWEPDGLQRDGPHVREPVDARLRAALAAHGFAYGVVAGAGEARVESAWGAVSRLVRPAATARAPGERGTGGAKRWSWLCERCGDPDCERDSHPALGGRDLKR